MREFSYGYGVLAFSYLMTHAAIAATLLAVTDEPEKSDTKVVLPSLSQYPVQIIRANPYFIIRRETNPLGCKGEVSIKSTGMRPSILMTAKVQYNEPLKTTFIEFDGVPTDAILAAANADPEPIFDLKVISDYLTLESIHALYLTPLVVRQFEVIGRFVYRPLFTEGDNWEFRGEFTPNSEAPVSRGLSHFLTSTLVRAWNSINL